MSRILVSLAFCSGVLVDLYSCGTSYPARHIREIVTEECSGVHTEVIVSPKLNSSTLNVLILFWEAATVLQGDWVGLFNEDPRENTKNPLFKIEVHNHTGWVTTGIQEQRNGSIPTVFTKQCLGYWSAYVCSDSGGITAVSCLSTEPRWMEDSWSAISRLSLAKLFLPGTHNAASYKEIFSPYVENIVYKYTYNQDLSVLNQLLWGSRVLDIRVAYYPRTPEIWWCNHDFVKLRPLKTVLDEVKLFLNNTEEIVVLDFHHFPIGFASNKMEKHSDLLQYIEIEMTDWLIPNLHGWNTPISELKKTGRKAILAYNFEMVSSAYKWIPVQHKWGNVQTPSQLNDYFNKIFQSYVTVPWSAMAELTPRAWDVLSDSSGGLRQMADDVNPMVTSWFNGMWGRVCHIVSVDFIRGTGIVKAAIRWNKQRSGHRICSMSYNSSTTTSF